MSAPVTSISRFKALFTEGCNLAGQGAIADKVENDRSDGSGFSKNDSSGEELELVTTIFALLNKRVECASSQTYVISPKLPRKTAGVRLIFELLRRFIKMGCCVLASFRWSD